MNVLSIARVSPEDRYSVRKVPSVNGTRPPPCLFDHFLTRRFIQDSTLPHIAWGTGISLTPEYAFSYSLVFRVLIRARRRSTSSSNRYVHWKRETTPTAVLQLSKRSVRYAHAQRTCTHILLAVSRRGAYSELYSVPHYVITSRDLGPGKINWALSWCRRFLIEELYRRIGKFSRHRYGWI